MALRRTASLRPLLRRMLGGRRSPHTRAFGAKVNAGGGNTFIEPKMDPGRNRPTRQNPDGDTSMVTGCDAYTVGEPLHATCTRI